MNTKSQSKNVLNIKSKFLIDPSIKRHKSQESYSDAKIIFDKFKTKTKIEERKQTTNKFETYSKVKRPEVKEFDISSTKKQLHVEKNTSPRIIYNDDSIRHINTEENVPNFKIKEDECNDELADLTDDVDEMRSSQVFTDFYTNSIGEASSSIVEKGRGIINNLPKPFVKQAENKIKINEDHSNNTSISNTSSENNKDLEEVKMKKKIDLTYRKLLVNSKKGDRDGFLECLAKLFRMEGNKLNINYKDESDWTCLHYACDEGNLKIEEILVKMNVDLNAKTNNKKTALHLAAEKGYFDVTRILIENGATISSLDDEKNTLIHICSMKGHVELLKYLLERHPQADYKNIYGKTPLDLAKSERIKEILKEYLAKNTYQYHKIKIHDAKDKTVNNMLINFPNYKDTSDKKKKMNGNILVNHNKFQSNDFNAYAYGTTNALRNGTNLNNYNGSSNLQIRGSNKKISNLSKVTKTNLASNTNSSAKSTTSISSQLTNKQHKRSEDEDILPSDNSDDEESLNPTSSLDEDKIGPSDFICHALIGKGSFGEVYLVEKKNTRTLHAMKILSKDKIMAQNLVKYAMTERNVLSVTDHPFIVKLSYAFQSSKKLFLILDYCPGGDLSEHLTREKRFTEERAKIYLCELILALEDLHKRDIIFRDLKPDNVVLDSRGHAMLTDFGLSKEGVLDNKGAKSFCGSIAYLAPEMLKRTGHGKSVDWYLLGVLFYEMLVGVPPYFTNNKDQLFKNIEHGELHYPKHISEFGISLLKGLLHKDPQSRLGAGKLDAAEVKRHAYFKDLHWDDVYNRKLNPPVPVFKNKVLEKYPVPRAFNEINTDIDGNLFLGDANHFDGWSFINNTNQK